MQTDLNSCVPDYLADAVPVLEERIVAIFNQAPIQDQPVGIACNDNALLKRLYEVICRKTRRAAALEDYPLALIGIDNNPAALPDAELFKACGIQNPAQVLYLYAVAEPACLSAETADWTSVFLRWAKLPGPHGLIVLARHELPSQDAGRHATPDAGTFLIHAANAGLFAAIQPLRYPQTGPVCTVSLSHFEQRDYRIRHAEDNDLDALMNLERQCWPKALQASAAQIAARLKSYPQGQFVLLIDGQVVGVIYSQRIADTNGLRDISAEQVFCLHRGDGAVVQLIAVNIQPDKQHCNLGDQLLEFMLQRCSLMPGVESVAAVTRCKDYRQQDMPLHDYINKRNAQGRLIDPVLRFHELHGARIEGLIPGYRPMDGHNQGHGVLVHYDIHRRVRDELRHGQLGAPETVSQPAILRFVNDAVKAALGSGNAAAFSADGPLLNMGLDSADLLQLGERIGFHYKLKLEPGFFFQYSTAEKICTYLSDRISATHPAAKTQDAGLADNFRQEYLGDNEGIAGEISDADIAIIGLSGRYPKAGNIDAFWEYLKNGVDCITEIPEDRWNYRDARHVRQSRWGGFIDGVDCFDPLFFNISPSEAEMMDPQERLFLETAWHAVEDAGYSRQSLQQAFGGKVGVFVGVMYGEYPLFRDNDDADVPFLFYGSIANRVSYVFDFHGPSMAVDTLCSSSLTALHQAVASVRRGECAAAIVGGVNLSLHPNKYRLHAQLAMSSSDGRCRSFGAGGDGFVPGEGVGAVLIKPARQAVSDGDHIYAVIKATAINHDGKTYGYTVPNPNAQTDMILAALNEARISPQAVSYVEAHGTGTALGDPVEITGLSKAFGLTTDAVQYCALGSVKSNIGHLEAAAGIAGLTKILLQMKHRQRAPSLHSTQPNPNINFGKSPFYIPQTLEAWPRPRIDGIAHPRLACLSSFGAGGANAHAVIAEYNDAVAIDATANSEPQLVILSAKRQDRLKIQVEALLVAIGSESWQANRRHTLRNLAYTLQVGREAMDERLGWVAVSLDDLKGQLAAYIEGRSDRPASIAGDAPPAVRRMLRCWLDGDSIDWQLLHQGAKPLRISLPMYPFARQRYWLPEADKKPQQQMLHPLLQQNTSTLSELRFSSTFTGDEFFLADHRIQGRKILPGVAHLEMALTAVAQVAEHLHEKQAAVRLNNVLWSRPLVLESGEQQVHISLTATEHGPIRYQVYTDAEDGSRDALLHSHGTADFYTADTVPHLDLAQRQAAGDACQVDGATCYRLFKTMGFDYGPAHQGIDRLYIGHEQVLARLQLPDSVRDSLGQYVLHPGLLDAALQSSLGLVDEFRVALASGEVVQGAPPLPFALAELRLYAGCSSVMWAWARYAEDSGPGDAVRKLDIDLCDDNGRVCVQMKGFSLHRAEEQTAPETSIGALLCRPVWREEVAAAAQEPGYARHLLLCEPLHYSTESIVAQLPGISCLCLQSAETAADKRYQAIAAQVFAQLQAMAAQKTKGICLVQCLSLADGSQGLYSALSGLLKTAHLEYPERLVQVIEIEPETSVERLLGIIRENRDAPQAMHIRYRNNRRQVLGWEDMPVPDAGGLPWKERGVYLITGGLGGLGLIFAKEIAFRVRDVTLILAGRSPLNEAKRAELKALEALGARVEYRECDVSRRHQVDNLARWIKTAFGGLHGILHCAGVSHDNFIVNKSLTEFAEVLAPKVSGLVHLDQATQDLGLDFFIAFSSLVGVAGNPGQADYAAANAFVDAYAAYRRQLVEAKQRSGLTLAIAWPLWREGGMRIDAASETMLKAAKGWVAMETNAGIQAFYHCVAAGLPQILVMAGEPTRLRQSIAALMRNVVGAPAVLQIAGVGDIQQVLLPIISGVLKIEQEELAVDKELRLYGFDSIKMTEFFLQFERKYQLSLPPTAFFDHPTIAGFAAYLAEAYPAAWGQQPQASDQPKRRPRPEARGEAADAIAIVGLSGRFPMAQDLDDYWENLKAEHNCITEIPTERWDWQAVDDGSATAAQKTTNRWGGFIDDVKAFDPLFFGISPRDAHYMDPQLRLLITTIWQALENGGITPKTLAGDPTGVFIAAAPGEYSSLIAGACSRPEDFSAQFPSAMPNRISQLFDLSGPSECYEAACASSLVALHRAIQSIQRNECAQAIVAAVNLLLAPERYIASEMLGYLSPDGQARSFQAGANGFVRAEGVGAVIVKPLRKALEDGNVIYALVKGTGVAHGGKGLSLTAPNPAGMKAAMVQAYRAAGIDPATVSYIEAHGVASPLSDAQEINALKAGYQELASAYPKPDAGERAVYISSLKPSIGHSEIASGIAALCKVVYALRDQLIPGMPRFTGLHEQVSLDGSPFVISTGNRPWTALNGVDGKPLPRRASISGYGDAGVNGHIVLEEYVDARQEQEPDQDEPHLIVLSARTDERLAEMAFNLQQFVQRSSCRVADIAYTLQIGRKAMDSRLAMVVGNRQELMQGLQDYLDAAAFRITRTESAISLYTGHAGTAGAAMAAYPAFVDGAALSARHLEQLAAYWTQGGELPWERLYQGSKARRIPLPTYPFERGQYWLDVDRRRTAVAESPDNAQPAQDLSDAAPFSAYLKQILADILGLPGEQLPAAQSLNQLGLTSLHALTLKARLEQRYGIAIPLAEIDVYQSLNDLDGRLTTRLPQLVPTSGQDIAAMLPVIIANPAEHYQPFPLSDIQQAFWLGRKLGSADARVGCHVYLEIETTALDIYRLDQAWNRLIDYHAMLRAVFLADGRQQILDDRPPYTLVAVDLRRKTAAQQAEYLQTLRVKLSHQVYDAERWPLFEIRISICPDSRYIIHFSIDELIVDASAVEMLFQQWQQLYEQPETELAPLTLSFRDYQLAARQFEESGRYRNDLHYWLAKLQHLPAGPALPVAQTPGLHRCERLSGTLEAVQWQALKQRAVALNVSPTALLLGIFAEVLRAWSERKSFTLVLTFFNRAPVHAQIEQVLGPFISTMLFVVEEAGSLEHLIQNTQKTLFADLDHSAVSGLRVLRELKRSHQLESTLPLPVVFTSLLGKKITRDSRSFLENISYAVTQTPQVYLDHQLYELDGQLRFSWDVVKDYFADGVIDGVFADYCRVLGELAGNTGQWPPELTACGPRNTEVCGLRFETFPERRGQAFPLTDLQQAYAFGKSPHSANMSSRIYSAIDAVYLDTDSLQHALQQLLVAHEMLVVVVGPDGTWQRSENIPAYTIPVADLRGEQPERIAVALADIEREMMAANCALGAWPHFELRVSHLDAVNSIVHFSVELLIADAVSIGLLRKQLCRFYHHTGDKPDISIRYADYLWSLENYRQSAGYQVSVDYWERKFADIPSAPKLPLRDNGVTHGTERLEAVLDNWSALKTMAARLSVTPGMVLLTAYTEVLAAWSDGQPFSIVMPSWQRLPLHEDIEQLVGDFTAMAWLAVEHQGGSFADKVQRNHRLVQQDLAHRAVSGLKALRKQALKRRNSGPLSFPVVFTDLEPDADYDLPDGFRLRKTLSQTAQVELDNISSDYGERLGLHWDVAQGRYPDGLVQDMFAAYQRLLAQLACDPESWRQTDFSYLLNAPYAN